MHAPTTHRHAPQAVLARHATVGVAGAKVVDEQRRIVHAGLDVALGEPAADQPCEPMSKPRGHRLRPAGSPEASVSAKPCSRLPWASVGLGPELQPLGPRWHPGHTGLDFDRGAHVTHRSKSHLVQLQSQASCSTAVPHTPSQRSCASWLRSFDSPWPEGQLRSMLLALSGDGVVGVSGSGNQGDIHRTNIFTRRASCLSR